ncbi:MAG: hypothetical protein DRI33_01035 [Caldiserica bacterium]|nr:MAG: hypothetical protein DRI33_01035 [Caldisericota bacterium]
MEKNQFSPEKLFIPSNFYQTILMHLSAKIKQIDINVLLLSNFSVTSSSILCDKNFIYYRIILYITDNYFMGKRNFFCRFAKEPQ